MPLFGMNLQGLHARFNEIVGEFVSRNHVPMTERQMAFLEAARQLVSPDPAPPSEHPDAALPRRRREIGLSSAEGQWVMYRGLWYWRRER
ncbi:hypothetical protein [Mycolicibacterium helvum]|uniref:hypothetical protein n=1 Tax=Mycolicibacterium helvum TaxID=1534349 RepID=UPI0013D252C9|nr:hypothetical protein [Mycolicibacterium helvum]